MDDGPIISFDYFANAEQNIEQIKFETKIILDVSMNRFVVIRITCFDWFAARNTTQNV